MRNFELCRFVAVLKKMRFHGWLAVSIGVMSLALRGDPPATLSPSRDPLTLLGTALQKMADNQSNWSYTEVVTVTTGKKTEVTRVRFDPSKPYAEQFKPLELSGKVPTTAQIAQYRKRGEDRARRMDQEVQREGDNQAEDAQIYFGNQKAIPDLAAATISTETPQTATYLIPLLSAQRTHDQMLDKIELLVRVNKERQEFEHATFRLRDPLRVKWVAKIRQFDNDVDFSRVLDAFPPMITSIVVKMNVSLFFMKKSGRAELKRMDFQRVKPFDDGARVKTGPLRTLEF